MKKNLLLFAALALLLPGLAHATTDGTQQLQIMQSLLDKMQSAGKDWVTVTQGAALNVFGTLALVEMFMKMRKVVLSGGEEGPVRIIGILLTSMMTWGFFLWAIQNPDFVLGNIIHGFEALGGKASGLGALNPSQMIGAGVDIAGQISNGTSTWAMIGDPAIGIAVVFTELLIVMGFAVLGLQMFAALLHYYLLLACAPILLAGGALSFTRDWAIKQFQGAVATGVKIFVIYVIAGVVSSFVPQFQASINESTTGNMGPLLALMAAGVLILFLGFFAPSVASAIMGGTSSMSANEMAAFGASVGGAAAMGAGAVLGGAQMAGNLLGKGSQGMGALSNMAGNIGNALGQATSSGGSMKESLSTAGGGAGSAIDAAKRVGGDMPSGMSPATPQSKALMNLPAAGAGGRSPIDVSGNIEAAKAARDSAGAGSAGASSGAASGGGSDAAQSSSGGEPAASGAPTQTPSGDASNAAIGAQPSAPGMDSPSQTSGNTDKKPTTTQRARDLLAQTGQHFDRAKSFVPDAHNSGSMHINLQD
ncbi:P-type conjugative transfer protein TrbL [Paraburkholderia sp. A3RO-2L]|uniref:P-type conjugative transfer protein TrbL n=1 Tax=Paraburkholderia sp. A3RO-2L TaxID=3028376 RepID=UPI003DA893D1